MDRIGLVLNRGRWRAVVNAGMNHRGDSKMRGNS